MQTRSTAEQHRAARDLLLGLGVGVSALGSAFSSLMLRAILDLTAFIDRSGPATSPADPFLMAAVVAEVVTGVLFGGILIVAPSRWRIGLVSWGTAHLLLGVATYASLTTVR